MNDRQFIREASPWGFAATAVAMLGIWFSRFNDGTDALQSAGYALFALLLVPVVWIFAGRYAAYWLARTSRKQTVRLLFALFWAALTAKLFFIGWPVSISTPTIIFAAGSAVFSMYAAVRGFERVASGQIEPLRDPGMPTGWLLHSVLLFSFAILFAA